MDQQTKILIADDHPIFRTGLRQVIESDSTFTVIGEADDGDMALRLIDELKPDIIILDVNMPGKTGFEVATELQKKNVATRVVMMTMHKDEQTFSKAISLGVRGYVLKDGASGDIVACLNAVRRGENFTSAEVTKYLFKRAANKSSRPVEGLGSLTPTERRIVGLIAEYLTSREIADKLCISIRTVENHRNSICAKLGVRGSHALMKFALQHQAEL